MSTSESIDPPPTGADALDRLDWRFGGTAGAVVGATNTIADVPGITVGHAQRVGAGWLSGVSVILARGGARGGVDVRGGGPATKETTSLQPSSVVERVPGIVLSGGSAYGLDASGGALEALAAEGMGFRTGTGPTEVVPVVPAASIYDLGRGGDFAAHPGRDLGFEAARRALEAAPGEAVEQGNVGAGTGAYAGEMRGGVGTASVVLPGDEGPVTVGAYVVLNSHGSAVDPRSGAPWGEFAELSLADGSGEFGLRRPTSEENRVALERWMATAATRYSRAPLNTTLAVVATDADLTRAELGRLAIASGAGLARAIRPVYTMSDGDIVFTLGTGGADLPSAGISQIADLDRGNRVNRVLAAGADVVTRAIVHALLSATTATTPDGVVPSYRDLYAQPR